MIGTLTGSNMQGTKQNRSSSNNSYSHRRSSVHMFEIVDAVRWTIDKNGSIDDLRPLLHLMDIGSCASAEKHTGFYCVTASMRDVVIEAYPRVGELLELKAFPVRTGRTSLDIAVTVIAHGSEDEGINVDGDDDEPDTASSKRVCEALFTYVTTRGPNGEKRFVPALESCPANFQSDKKCSKTKQPTQNYNIPRSDAVFESSEVVLPCHQNHMGHLFGGIVMGWMCKSVVAACGIATHLPLNRFKIRAIQRIDFPRGADVRDHLFFRPKIKAVFARGTSAEVEVMVGKRNVTGNTITTPDEETTINIGTFFVTGADLKDEVNSSCPRLSTRVAPFAGLFKSGNESLANVTASDQSRITTEFERVKRRKMVVKERYRCGTVCHTTDVTAEVAVETNSIRLPMATIQQSLLAQSHKKSELLAMMPSTLLRSTCKRYWKTLQLLRKKRVAATLLSQ